MNRFIDHIENTFKIEDNSHDAYLYKREVLDSMTERAKEVARSGLSDEKVIADLIKDEFSDLTAGFAGYKKKKLRRKLLKYALPIGIIAFVILTLAAYFITSGVTGAWEKTWLIIVGGVFALIIFCFILLIAKLCSMRRVFHPIARVLLVICTILISVFAFLFLHIMVPTELFVWPTLLGGVILALAGDLIFAFGTKQKLRTISFFFYMPAITALLYVMLAANGAVTWNGGWPIVLVGLAVDFAYIIYIIMSNMKYFTYKQEVDE